MRWLGVSRSLGGAWQRFRGDAQALEQKGQAVEQLLEWRGIRAANARQLDTRRKYREDDLLC